MVTANIEKKDCGVNIPLFFVESSLWTISVCVRALNENDDK